MARTRNRAERDRARRTLSQHLLHQRAAVDRLVSVARPAAAGLVVEVGAGTGALTVALAPRCRRLVAYEIDPHLFGVLRARCAPHPGVCCVRGDFLAARPPREPFAVVGNLPFARTADIVSWCLHAPRLTSATLVTQLEYARRRSGDYGRWSLRTVETWPEFRWELRGRLSRTAFRPVPAVDAGILRLERRPRRLLTDPELAAYRRLVRLGFGGHGGSLYASLRRGHPGRRVSAAFRAAELDRDTPVGLVPPERWLALFEVLHRNSER